jgi:hypothetical protein
MGRSTAEAKAAVSRFDVGEGLNSPARHLLSRRCAGTVKNASAEMVWSHFRALQIFLFTLILMYCTAREVIRAVGAPAVRKMFSGPL